MLGATFALAVLAAPSLQEPDFLDKVERLRDQAAREIDEARATAEEFDLEEVNSALDFLAGEGHGLQFLRDVDFELKAISNEAGDSTLGFSFDYHKAHKQWVETGPASEWGLEFGLRSSGSVAFEREFNPEDLIETKLSLSWFRNDGGITASASDDLFDKLNELEDAGAAIEDPDELAASPVMRELDGLLEGYLANQLYLDLGVDGGLESNQAFSQKNVTYGVRLGMVYTPWRKDSLGAALNLLDYPFAALRLATGHDDEFRLIGATFPSLVLHLDRVKPSDGAPRDEAGDSSDYSRLSGELAFRTPIAHLGMLGLGADEDVDDGDPRLYFDASWRVFHELNASSVVQAAELDRYSYVEVALRASTGVYVSYANGQLPFDRADARSFQAGFQFGL
jgi:hypothetical protein